MCDTKQAHHREGPLCVERYLVQQKTVSHTFKGTHITGKFMSLEGMRSLIQCPGISFHFIPAPWTEGGVGINAVTTSASNCSKFERKRYSV